MKERRDGEDTVALIKEIGSSTAMWIERINGTEPTWTVTTNWIGDINNKFSVARPTLVECLRVTRDHLSNEKTEQKQG